MQTQAYNLPRQLERVLLAAKSGMSEKQTARELGLEVGTVKQYRNRLRCKLMARNMTEAVAKAYEQGYLRIIPAFLICALLFGMDQEARPLRAVRGNTSIVRNIQKV